MRPIISLLIFSSLISFCYSNPPSGVTITLAPKDPYAYLPDPQPADALLRPPSTHNDFTEHYFQNLKRTIVLEDGREVRCNIPLYDVEPQPEVTSTRNLTKEEADDFMTNIRDSCVRKRTDDFLWEFCYDKYARQYDDELTVQNAQKHAKELYFLGFANKQQSLRYRVLITENTGAYTPPPSHTDIISSFEIPEYKYAYVNGNMLRLTNVKKSISINMKHFVNFWVPKRIIKDDFIIDTGLKYKMLKDINNTAKYTKILHREEHIHIRRLIKDVIMDDILIMEDGFPVECVVEDVSIDSISDSTKKIPDEDSYYGNIHKTYVYGPAFSFLTMVREGNSIVLIFNKTIFHSRIVMKIHSDFVIEIDKEVKDVAKYNYILTDIFIVVSNNSDYPDRQYRLMRNNVTVFGNMILGDENATFIQQIKPGDLFRTVMKSHPFTVYVAQVKRVINNYTLETFEPNIPHTGNKKIKEFLVGSYLNLAEHRKKHEVKREKYVYDVLEDINYEIPPHMIVLYTPEEMNNDVKHQSFRFKDPSYWLIQFTYYELVSQSSLMFTFTENKEDAEGINVHFQDLKKVLIKRSDDFSKFKSASVHTDINGSSVSFHETPIWIVHAEGMLRIGLGNIISAERQIVAFPTMQNLGYFRLKRAFTYNLYLTEVSVMTPSIVLKKTLANIDKRPQDMTESIKFFQHFEDGSFCPPKGSARTVDVEFRCSKNGVFMEIEDILEPSTCSYHMIIGTYFLCPSRESGNSDIREFSTMISCVI